MRTPRPRAPLPRRASSHGAHSGRCRLQARASRVRFATCHGPLPPEPFPGLARGLERPVRAAGVGSGVFQNGSGTRRASSTRRPAGCPGPPPDRRRASAAASGTRAAGAQRRAREQRRQLQRRLTSDRLRRQDDHDAQQEAAEPAPEQRRRRSGSRCGIVFGAPRHARTSGSDQSRPTATRRSSTPHAFSQACSHRAERHRPRR